MAFDVARLRQLQGVSDVTVEHLAERVMEISERLLLALPGEDLIIGWQQVHPKPVPPAKQRDLYLHLAERGVSVKVSGTPGERTSFFTLVINPVGTMGSVTYTTGK